MAKTKKAVTVIAQRSSRQHMMQVEQVVCRQQKHTTSALGQESRSPSYNLGSTGLQGCNNISEVSNVEASEDCSIIRNGVFVFSSGDRGIMKTVEPGQRE